MNDRDFIRLAALRPRLGAAMGCNLASNAINRKDNAMISFSLSIESGDAAMVEDPQGEIWRALQIVADKVAIGHDEGYIRDSNGNLIGSWALGNDE